MATKELMTRIRVRYDTLANWNSKNPDLLKGEIAVAEIPANTSAGIVISEPAFLIKVGTGEEGTTTSYGGLTGQTAINKTSFKALPFVTAQAGDVYAWAKEEKLRITQDSDIHADTKTYLQNLVSGTINDSDTVYTLEFGTGEHAGQIRFGSKDGKNEQATWTYVDGSTNNGWHSLGSTISAADDSVAVSAVSQGNQTIGVQISAASGNALTLKTANGEKGLYVKEYETTITNETAVNNNTNATVDVVTGIAQNSTNKYQLDVSKETVYTKHQIDTLLNPGMEFKGIIGPTAPAETIVTADIPTTGVKTGDSYKFSAAGSIGTTNAISVKAGDVIIALTDNPSAIIDDDTNWALIPAGDSDTDTHRSIKVDGTEILANGISSGALNLKAGNGIGLTNSAETGGQGVTFALNDTILTHLGYGDGASTNKLTKTIDNNGTPTTTQATVKEYVDIKFGNALTSASATIATENNDIITLKAGIVNSGQAVGNNSNNDIILAKVAKTGSITDLDVGDYLVLYGGNASSFAQQQS